MPTPSRSQRTLILVVGMHRSGTSATAATLGFLGAALPKRLMPAGRANLRGHFEPLALVDIHDRLLAAVGGRWAAWPALDAAFFASEQAAAFVGELAAEIEQDYADADPILVKDPRLCRLVPLWRRVAEASGLNLRVILVLRDPSEVAASLRAREDMPEEEGLLLWLTNMLEAERSTRGLPRALVRYDHLLRDWRQEIGRALEQAGIDLPKAGDPAAGAEVEAFLTPELRNHVGGAATEGGTAVPALVRKAAEALAALARDPAGPGNLGRLDRIARAVDAAAPWVGPAVTRLQEHHLLATPPAEAEMQARLRQLETELDKARDTETVWARRHALVENVLADRSSALNLANGEIDALRAEIARVAAANEPLAAQVSSLQAEIDGLRLRHGEAQARVQQVEADLEKAGDAEAALTRRLTLAESVLTDRFAALRCANGEIDLLRMKVARAATANAPLTVKVQSMQAEIDGLHRLRDDVAAARARVVGLEAREAMLRSRSFGASDVYGALFRRSQPRAAQVAAAVEDSGLFDRDWYLSAYGDVRGLGIDPVRHYVEHGFAEGRFPHALFDTQFYLEQNPDVRATGLNPLLHYARYGSREGRAPNRLLVPAWYRHAYAIGAVDPLLDYWHNWESGSRDPGPEFSSMDYVRRRPQPAGGITNPLARHLHGLP